MDDKYRVSTKTPFTGFAKALGYIIDHTRVLPTYRLQYVQSEGHPFRLLGKNDRLDIGGPFFNSKFEVDLGSWDPEWQVHINTSGTRYYEYFGIPCVPSGSDFGPGSIATMVTNLSQVVDNKEKARYHLDLRNPQALSSNELDAWGTSVINSVLPTNPTVDIAMSIGEFVSERKFFSLPGTSGSLPGEYLNYMFGIAPTLADIRDLRTAIAEQDKILAQYARDSGRLVRRRYEPEPTIVNRHEVIDDVYPENIGSHESVYVHERGRLTHTQKSTTKLWFSGAFTYHFPQEGLPKTLAELDRLYGVVPGVGLTWELLPFSWLLDYKLSIGAAIGNFDSFIQDGLVMPYAYVMAQQEIVDHYVWVGNIKNFDGVFQPRRLTAVVKRTVQQRRPATPFGFGLLPGELSARQLSIIAALGLTKLDK